MHPLSINLKAFRLSKGMSRQQFAIATKTKYCTILAYETRDQWPGRRFFAVLVEKYGVDLNELIFNNK